ncbi:phosphate ABC transporter substrate-binding/OmpA family protein [Aliiroseovarius sp. 2305UL8-7]|uniref:phosphate ABC transporter substrate-binding/OmpA family protein n=1 Tax=Aliiroseovarius conchicola TaxID=3121637 RepID=UPI0035281490
MNWLSKLKTTTAAALAVSVLTVPAIGQEVRLIGTDSNINITGTLLSARDGKYLVETEIGEFIIDQELVTCEGEGCPAGLDLAYDLEIAAPDVLAEVLVPILADGYAASNLDAEAQLLDANGEPVDTETVDVGDHAFGKELEFAVQMTDFDGETAGTFGIHTGFGSRLYERMAAKEAGIVFTESPARKAHRAAVADSGGGNLRDFAQERVIAVDGFTMIVNPANNVPHLSIEQATQIFKGEITNWSEVGGSNAPINVYTFNPGTEAFHMIEELLFKKQEVNVTEDSSVVHSTRELTTAVLDDPAGFGIVSFSSKRDARAVPLRSECGIIQAPSAFNIKTEEYELQSRVIAYNRRDVQGLGREFVDYLEDSDIDGLVSKAGLTSLTIVSDTQQEAIERLTAELEEGENEYEAELAEALLKNMNTHERLSTTFRFAPGSDRLDNKARRDMARMLSYIAERKPSEIVVVGFTDNKGPFDPNLLISRERAQSVLEKLQAAATDGQLDGITLKAEGYGELEPVACNTNPKGRATNRRVEFWVKS